MRRLRERARPDLVLLDIWMPDADGITLLKEWAASGQLTMPVVMMSGHATIETAVEATRIGALDFLEKPIALQRLLATVKRALRNRRLRRRRAFHRRAWARTGPRRGQEAPRAARRLRRAASVARRARHARGTFRAPARRAQRAVHRGRESCSQPPSELLRRRRAGFCSSPIRARLGTPSSATSNFSCHARRSTACAWCRSRRSTCARLPRRRTSTRLGARLGELTLNASVREFAEDVPDLASLMLAQLVEARACPPRRFAIAALNALRHHGLAGQLTELESVVKDLALSTPEEEVAHDVERALAAQAVPGMLPEVAFDRPLPRSARSFRARIFENLLARENGSMSRVAERSGLERTHLYRKLKALGARLDDARRPKSSWVS